MNKKDKVILLPLPEYDQQSAGNYGIEDDCYSADAMEKYARANVEQVIANVLRLAELWERHAREYAADAEDSRNGLSDEHRQEQRIREAMCTHHAIKLRRTCM